MSRIDDALDRFEAAARKSGLTIGHADDPRDIKIPFDEDHFMPILKEQQITLSNEYLACLRRWNGMSIVKGVPNWPEPSRQIAIDIEITSIERSLYRYQRMSQFYDPNRSPIEMSWMASGRFFPFSSCGSMHREVAFDNFELMLCTDGGGIVVRTEFWSNDLYPGFESFSNLIECCAEGLEEGVSTVLSSDDLVEDWDSRIAFWSICARKNPYFPVWQYDIRAFDKFKEEAKKRM